MKDADRHYNWQLLRFNPEYQMDFDILRECLSSELPSEIMDSIYINGSLDFPVDDKKHKKVINVCNELIAEFTSKWRMSQPVNYKTSNLPSFVSFANLKPFVIEAKKIKNWDMSPPMTIGSVCRGKLPSVTYFNNEVGELSVAVVFIDLRFVDETNINNLNKTIMKMSKPYLKKPKVSIEEKTLEMQLECYKLSGKSWTKTEIAAHLMKKYKIWGSYHPRQKTGDITKFLDRMNRLAKLAPIVRFNIK